MSYLAARGGTGGSGPTENFANGETPSGLINGTNTVFNLAHNPSPDASLQLFLNGALQELGVDYTLSGATITFADAPLTGSPLLAYYRY